MLILRIYIVLFLLVVNLTGFAQQKNFSCPNNSKVSLFNPYITVMPFVSWYNRSEIIEHGKFEIQNRKGSLGFELGNRFPLTDQLFLSLGIRYFNNKSTINGLNQLSGYTEKPYPLVWKRSYDEFSVPISIIREWSFSNGRKLEVQLGVANGIVALGEVSNAIHYESIYDHQGFDSIGLDNIDTTVNQFPAYYQLVAQIGVAIQPFSKIEGFRVGLSYYYQVNQIKSTYSYTGSVANITKNEHYAYDVKLDIGRIQHIALNFTYRF